MKTVSLTINDNKIEVPEYYTVLYAAKEAGIIIPTLCYHDDLCIAGNCRVCLVEQKGMRSLQASCTLQVAQGMIIYTNTRRVREARRTIIELLLSEHSDNCTTCYKNGKCELQQLAKEYLIDGEKYIKIIRHWNVDDSSPSLIKDDSKCIKCTRCVRTCEELQGVSALYSSHKGEDLKITTFFDKPLNDVICTNCGQCINRCPTGALIEKNYIKEVWDAIDDEEKFVVVQTAPAVRVSISEALGYEIGQISTGKLVAALRRLGFNAVLDTDFTADLTIIEEGNEFLQRITKALRDKQNVALPMTTSCSPGWIKFVEHKYPELLDNVSTCKSPQQMFGALAKTYYANKRNIDPAKMITVSIMPCTAKKYEANRPEMYSSGYKDVDYVLTTRELALMIQQAGIDFEKLPDENYDSIMGQSTGAAVIFGATGGVMEAALRTVYEIVTGKEVPFDKLNILPVRGMEGVRSTSITISGTRSEYNFLEGVTLNVAVAHGLANAALLMDEVKEGKSNYHFIEIMACPGGCIGGGGQPLPTNRVIRKIRSEAIYEADMQLPIRKSHENPEIKQIYQEFLKQPLGHISHNLLHTHYIKRQ
ncbi:MAG: NADH-dependent [FeFe] hydrogenase, group A6 [Spirochaetes bacterium]|nr:NADH-dependent [FeFe] hydrogenase, group A6 [Spirochaetota bacterium]